MGSLKDAIENARFQHPNYMQAVNAAISRISFMPRGSVIAMVGPTRVGKSAAIRDAASQTYPARSEGTVPYTVADCSRTDSGFASTRYITLDLLVKLEHPFYTDDDHRLRLSQTETDARLRLRKAIEHRETRLIIFDEAHHLLRVKNRAGKEAALESLKCLGNETGALIFLVGGYELLRACFCSAHLNGRLSLIEFSRYKRDPQSIRDFDCILASYDRMLPWAKGHSLLSMREFIYSGTLGSCGLIGNWVLLALAQMSSLDHHKLCRDHFRNARYKQQVQEIASEIEFGESVLSPIENGSEGLRISAPEDTTSSARTTKQKRRPGRRNPHRDPTCRGRRSS
jgi:hypothetical protein